MNKLYLHNSQTRKIEEFIPLNSDHITMYVCGPTVYDKLHLGNARPLVIFDCLFRLLEILYPKVTYVRNITDIDDKIINKAIEQNITYSQVVEKNLVWYQQNLADLNIKSPTFEPFATQHIKDMQQLISQLVDSGFAYEQEGNVFFNTKKFKHYGELSGKPKDEALVNIDSLTEHLKQSHADFVLWKPAKEGEPYWGSPWGNGRPGWHIECSAMAKSFLGNTFDIHGGGSDLIFPHHENERAQSMAANNTSFLAKYWVHNAFINMDSEKMSKSLGNVVTIDSILQKYDGEVLRLAILMTHYRHPLNFKPELLEQAKNILDKMYLSLSDIDEEEQKITSKVKINQEVLNALLDDLNTPKAIGELQKLITNLNKLKANSSNIIELNSLRNEIIRTSQILGLLQKSPGQWLHSLTVSNSFSLSEAEIENLITERQIAKDNKEYAKADKIRNDLLSKGIILEDSKTKTTWRKQ
ncbi:cysteine--tRNA ligase [Rickettsiales bacterium LUAb2]